MRTAIIVGATGLVGSFLVKELLDSEFYSSVVVFTRRSINLTHEKLNEHIINFDDFENWKHLIHGDDLYSTMGTTIKKAGSQKAQYLVDYTYPYWVAQEARNNNIKNYALISSAGANANSKVFYSRMKGELERDIEALNFTKTIIARPSVIDGPRAEKRLGEKMALIIMQGFKHIPGLKKYRPAHASDIAKCLIRATNDSDITGVKYFNWNEVIDYAQS